VAPAGGDEGITLLFGRPGVEALRGAGVTSASRCRCLPGPSLRARHRFPRDGPRGNRPRAENARLLRPLKLTRAQAAPPLPVTPSTRSGALSRDPFADDSTSHLPRGRERTAGTGTSPTGIAPRLAAGILSAIGPQWTYRAPGTHHARPAANTAESP
jgi:hypothetical protein